MLRALRESQGGAVAVDDAELDAEAGRAHGARRASISRPKAGRRLAGAEYWPRAG